MKTTYIKVDGTEEEVTPKDGKHFSYNELSNFVGGMVEIVPMPSGLLMICNEEGKLLRLGKNEKGTEIWKKEYPIEKYPNNNDELIAGDVLVCESKYLEE